MKKKAAFRRNTIVTIIVAMLCFSCVFAAAFVDGNNANFDGKLKFTAGGSLTVTLKTHASTPDLTASGYTGTGETRTTNTAAVGEALPRPAGFTSGGATFTFVNWLTATGAITTTVQAANDTYTASWRADVGSGAALKAAESKYVREINITSDIILDANPTVTSVLIKGGDNQTGNDDVVFQALAPVKIIGNDHVIAANITGTNSAGICNTSPSQYIMFYAGTLGTLDISNLTLYGGGKQALAVYNSTATMTNCTASRCGSSTYGGGAIVVSTNGKFKASKCNFKRNVARYGGAILITGQKDMSEASNSGSTALLESCVLNENRNVNVGQTGGGAMEINNFSKLYFVNSTLSNNQSTEIGGGVNTGKKAEIFVINSTVTGNVTYGTDVISFGGGLGMNEGKIHVYNSIINNNYHCTSGGNVTQCDIGLYGGSSATLDAHNSIIGSVYSGTSSTNVTSTYTGGNTTNKTGNSGIGNTGDFYRYESINILNPDGTVKTTLDEAKAKSPIITDDKIYLLAGNSSALSGGAYIYFNGDDINNIKFGYGPNDQSITRVKGEPTTADKITLFKNGVERNQKNIVMGALYSIPAGEEYVKITGTVKGEGTVEGRSIYPNYYLVGRKATFTAEAKTGFAFEGYYDVTPVSGSSPKNKFLSTDLAFTFEVKKADDNMILEARFVNASDSAVVFTTYGGAMTSGYTATVSNQVYKHAYVADWANNKPTPTYASGGTFVGWYADSTFTTLATFANANTKNYYAKVTDNITYNFKDDKNNAITSGVTNPSANATIYVRNVGITFAQPTLANYFFVGWKDATNATITGLDQTATGAKTITGVFKQRTISFNMNGATSSQISPMSVTGAEQTLATPTKTSMFFGGWSFVANGTAYTIQSGQPFTAAYAQLMNTYNVEDLVLTAVWTSKPAVDFVVLTPQTFTYDGTQHAFVPQMTSGHEKENGFEITYSSDNSAYSTTAPTSAGTYYVKIYRAETTTYAEYSAVIASGLVINKASLTKPTLSNTDYIYRGTAQSASLNGVVGDKMTVTNNSQTNAGTYNTASGNAIKVIIRDYVNYKWTDGTTAFVFIDWTIRQVQLTTAEPTVTSKVYDGNDNAISCVTKGIVSGIVEKDTLSVSVSIATATFNTADIAANQVTVTYTITGDNNNNYIKPVDSTITSATITPATITYTANGYTGAYDGNAHSITVSVTGTIGGQIATIKYSSTSNGTYNATELKYSDCVTQTVYFKITAPNHNEITSSATVEITPATITYSAVGYSNIYDGSAHGITVSEAGTIGSQIATIKYSNNNGRTYELTSSPTFTNYTNGEQTVYFQITAPNHNDIKSSATVMISKASVVVNGLALSDKIYGDIATGAFTDFTKSAGTVTGVGSENATTINGLFTFTFTAQDGQLSSAKLLKAGNNYTANYTFTSNNTNYNNTSGNVTFNVNKAALTATFSGHNNLTYDGNNRTVGVALNGAKNGDKVLAVLAYTISGQAATVCDAATYVATATLSTATSVENADSANYTLNNATQAFEIKPFGVTVTINNIATGTSGYTYDGQPKTTNATYTQIYKSATLDIVLAYKLNGNDAETAHINAGTWNISIASATITAGNDKASNYNIITTATATMVIDKATLTMPILSGNYTYNGSAQTATLANVGDKMTVSNNRQTNAATYTITVALNDTANYKWSGAGDNTTDVQISWTIAQATLPAIGKINDSVYTGARQEPTVVINGMVGGTLQMLVKGQDYTIEWSDGGRLINADTYTVTATGIGNYTSTQTQTYIITKATYDMSGVSFVDASKEYNGEVQTLAIGGTALPTGVSVAYSAGIKDVGSKVITATFAGDATNYNAIANKTATLTIIQKALTITGVTANERVYNGTTVVALTGGTLNGKVGADDVTHTLGAGSIANADAGNAKVVTYTATLTGTKAGNYTVTSNVVTVNIAKATYNMLGVSFVDASKEYNGEVQTLAISGTALPQNVTVGYSAGITNVGSKVITATFAGDATNYNAIANKTATLTIIPKALTITGVTATNRVYDGTTVVTLTGGIFAGKIATDDVSYTLSDGSIENANVGNAKVVTYTATLTGTTKGNYTVTSNVVTVNIAKATYNMLGVEWNYTSSFTYDNTQKTVEIKANTLPQGVSVNAYLNNSGIIAGNYIASVTFTYDTVNYNEPTVANCAWVINKATAIITTSGVTTTYTYTGSQITVNSGATLNHSEATLTYANNTFITVADGNGKIVTISAIETTNYKSATASVTLTVNKATAIITTTGVTTTYTYTGNSQTVSSGATLNHSEATLTYANNTFTTVLDGNGKKVEISAIETTNYKSATASVTLTVNKADYVMTDVGFASASKEYNGAKQSIAVTGTLPTGADGVRVTVSVVGSKKNVSGAAANITATFATASPNYNAPTAKTATLTITPKSISVVWVGENGSASDFSWIYNGMNIAPTASVETGVANETYNLTVNGGQINAGGYTATAVAANDVTVTTKANYTLGNITQAFSITKAALTIQADNKYIEYGKAAPFFTASYSGFAGGDDEYCLGGSRSITTNYFQGKDVGSYDITPSDFTSGNYEITFVNGTLTVIKAIYNMNSIRWTSPAEFTYNDTLRKISLTGIFPDGVSVSAYKDNAFTNAGDYTASVTFAYDTVNYEQPTFPNCPWKINKVVVEITWTATQFTYNGNNQAANVTATYADVRNQAVLLKTTLTSVGEFKNCQADGYKFEASFNNNETNYELPTDTTQLNKTYTMNKAEIAYSATSYSQAYDGKAHGIGLTATAFGNQNIVITFCNSEDGAFTSTAPMWTNFTNGAQIVWFKITVDNHNDVKASATVTINKATLPSITKISAQRYTGQRQEPTVEIKDDILGTVLTLGVDYDIAWSVDEGLTSADFINEGIYRVTATGKGNYAKTSACDYIINKADIAYTAVNYFGAYDGKAYGITFDNITIIGGQSYTITYSNDNGANYTLQTAPTFKDVTNGAQTVYFKITAPNHTDKTGQATVEITKATVAELTAGSKVYTGATLRSDIVATNLVSITTNNGGIDVGEYAVVIALVDTNNYKWETGAETQTRTIKFAITQAENAITNLHLSDWIYRESANAPTCDCNFGKPTFTYSAQKDGEFVATVPTNIGVWFVKASIVGTNNYKGAQAIATFSIVAYTYNITFDNGFGDTQTMPNQSRACDDGLTVTANTFERVGYLFVGWKVDGSEIVLPDGAKGNISDGQGDVIKLVAQWKRNVFTYAFFNDDLTLIFAKTANFGDTIEIPTAPTKADSAKCSYRFIGWDKTIPETLTGDLVFVAQFAVKTIYGDLDQNDDTDGNNCDIEVTLPENDKSVLSMTIKDITEQQLINNIDSALKNMSIKEYGANKVLKVDLFKDGKEIQFVGKYTVKLKEKEHDDFDIKIMQVVNDEMIEIQYVREGDYIVFDTVSLGNIVILEQNVDANLWALVVSNMVLLLLELSYLIFRKKPNKASKTDSPKGTKTNAFAFAPLGLLGAINVIPMYLQILLAAQTVVVIVLAFAMAIAFCRSKRRKKEEAIEIEPVEQPQIKQEFGVARQLTITEIVPIVFGQTENVAPPEQIERKVIAEEVAEVAEEVTEVAEVAEEVACEQAPIVDAPTQVVDEQESEENGVGVGVSIVEIDGKKVAISLRKSFTAKLIQSSEEVQGYYTQLKNRLESYKPLKARMSWDNDSYNSGRNKLVKFAIRGKTLVMFAALAPDDIVDEKFHVEYNSAKKYVDVPMMIRVKGPLKCKHASEMIDLVCAKFGLTFVEEKNDDYSQPYDTTESLIERNLIKVYADGDLNSADVIMAKFGQQGLHLIAATDNEEERAEEVAEVEQPEELEKAEEIVDNSVGKEVENDGESEVAAEVEQSEEENDGSDYIMVEGKKVYVSLRRSFLSKLTQVDSGIQKYYETIKNHILGYKNVKSRISWSNDTFNRGREKLIKMSIRGKTLVMNVALWPEDIEQDKYHVEYNNTAKYVETPMMIRVKGPLKLKHALELVDKVCEHNVLKFVADQDVDYTLPYKTNDELIEQDLIKVVYGAKGFGAKEV